MDTKENEIYGWTDESLSDGGGRVEEDKEGGERTRGVNLV